MLYPQNNPYRQFHDLSGFWTFRFDPADQGLQDAWVNGFDGGRPIAVPASWNDQYEDERDFLGPAWYQTQFDLPWDWQGDRIFLRFNSVNYLAEVWLNGSRLGQHEGGHLPFEFEVSSIAKSRSNQLVVRVDGNLAFDRVPPGNLTANAIDVFEGHAGNYPQAQFDFFPFCGIHRPVLLYAIPEEGIQDITVRTDIQDSQGIVQVHIETNSGKNDNARFTLRGHGREEISTVEVLDGDAHITLAVPQASFWCPGSPNLYQLTIELIQDGTPYDEYSFPVGIRAVSVEGDRLLLNGEPIYLTGFCRHEDFPVTGRGLLPALIIKDYALMQWMGANSFRTSHYPYSEQMMDLADRLGFLVIDETPAVGLYFREDGLERRLELCQQYVRELIDRDKNHPSVIMWSLANEPHSGRPEAKPFFRTLYDQAKSLDPTRPVTLVSYIGLFEEAFDFCDVVCLNRYFGWYTHPGQIDEGVNFLATELDVLHDKFAKPVILSEFGADTIPGVHAQPPEMFSEEYQVEFLMKYIEVLRSKPYVVGEHIWNMCDFKTSQGIRRMGGLNYKGVFTRDRRPKMAAHTLRKLWKG